MTLALPIAALLALALLVGAWAVRGGARLRWLQTLLVAVAPLAAFLLLVRRAPDRTPARALRVAGQYAPLADTVVVGNGRADVRVAAPELGAPAGAGVRLRVWYDPETHAVELRVDSGAAPVFVDGEPVNALPLDHGARVTLATRPGLEVEASLPRWPLACLVRSASLCAERALTVRGGGGAERRFVVRVGGAGVAAAALPDRRLLRAPFTLVAGEGGVFVAASPGGPVRVDGRAPPGAASAAAFDRAAQDGGGPELRVGAGSGATTMRVRPDTLGNRLDLLLVGRSMGERWAVPTGRARAALRVVAGVDPGPGTLRLLDLADVAPLGARARPYVGALEWTGAELRWHADGRTRVLAPGAIERLPGTGAPATERGHLVTITSSGPPREAILAVAGVWLAGALLLAVGTLGEGAPASALRVLVVGLVYVLAFIRLTIAYRVSSAEPYNGEALPWAALFLVAFPALVVLLERWPFARLAAPDARPDAAADDAPAAGTLARGLASVRALGSGARRADPARVGWALVVPLAVAGALAAGAGPLRLQLAHVTLGVVVLVLGTAGLLLLQRALVAPDGSAVAVGSPLGMLLPGAERGFGSRQVWRAFTALLVVIGLYVALAWSLRGIPSPLLAVLYAAAVGVAYTFVWARERVRPRMPTAWLARRAAGASLVVGAGAFLATAAVRPSASWVMPVAAGAAAALGAGLAVWWALLPLVRPVRGWPYRRHDVLPPLWFALLPAALILAAGWGGLRRVAITLGYALATAALLLVTRVFAAWWHRETGSRVRQRLGGPADRIPVGWVLGPLAAALVVYLTYGVVDPGLLMLLLVAVLFTTTITAATVGRLAVVGSAAATVLLFGAGFPRLIDVDSAALRARPLALSTAQIRYAAAYDREGLARQLALTDETTGREVVRMLQQDWGMRAYASAGGTRGRGLFSAPFNRAAIAEEVALTDNAFSVFVLGDHGFAGALAVLGAYVALALALLWAAHVAAGRVRTTHLAALLAGLAAYLVVPALYMAAANVQLLPLTGQNFPLLGLRSGADVAFVAWLAALAVVALPATARAGEGGVEERDDVEREEVRRSDLRRLRVTLRVAAAGIVAAAAWVLAGAWRATRAESGAFALDVLAADLRAMVDRGDLRLAGDSLAVAPHARGKAGLREGDLVRGLVARSNAAARGGMPARRGCLEASPWLLWGGDGDVRVSDVNCRVGTLEPGARWRGTLASAAVAPELLLVGLGAPVLLGDAASAAAPQRAVLRCDDGRADTVRAAAVELTCGPEGPSVLVRGGRRPSVEVVNGVALHNGEPLGAGSASGAGGAVRLAAGDVITLPDRRTVVVDSLPGGALAFARTRNGAVERMAAVDVPALVPALDTVLARTLATPRVGAGATVALTLDVGLGRAIQARLAAQCAALGAAKRCSAIVVDPERGSVLALASWERPGLRPAPYDAVDANFRAHRAGSVVKPIFAAAVLARYPALADLVVAHPADTFSTAAGWPIPGRPLHTRRNGCETPNVAWDCFIANSNNRFTVTLGLMGLAEEGKDGPALGDVAVGPPYWVRGSVVSRRPRLPEDRPAGYLASPLVRNLDALFGVRAGRPPVGVFDTTLWRPARERGLLRGGPSWQRVSPALPVLPIDDRDFGHLRHLAGFLIGETDNAWTNAALARSMSRLLTGRAVELRLVERVGGVPLPAETARALPFGPGRERVLEGMRGAVRGRGTASQVAALFPAPALDLVGKTGTLESDALDPLSAFMFGGRQRVAGGPRVCPAAGVVVVELERGGEERLRATALFADAVAPALRDHFGWGTVPCARR